MRTLLITAIAAAAVALPGTASAAAPAPAPDCGFTRTVCLWDATGYAGNRFTVSSLNPDVAACVDLAWHGWGNGRAKSGTNTGTRPARLYTGTDCTGTSYQLTPQGQYSSISFAANSILVY